MKSRKIKRRGAARTLSLARKRRIECRKARMRIHHLLDGRLTAAKAREVRKHLVTCRRCCSRYEFMRVLKHLVRRKVLAEACPGNLAERVRRAVSRLVHIR